MSSDSENAFRLLISNNHQAMNFLQEILTLDTQLENMRRQGVHPMMMDQKIMRIERLTYQVAEMAAEIGGGDLYEHASWLSYNIQKFMSSHLGLNPLSLQRQPMGCTLSAIIFSISILLFLTIIIF